MADRIDSIESVPVEELTPAEASRIVHSHSKVPYGTACWPCRQRKVKCDSQQPCENCVKRDHAQLCSYKPNRTSTSRQGPASQPGRSRKRARAQSETREDSTKNEFQGNWAPPLGMAPDDDSGTSGDRYVGQNSIPALLREQTTPSQRGEDAEIRRDMRSILGLDTSAPFPLMSEQHLQRISIDISSELPSDREVMKLFRTYKEVPHPFWGFIMDIDELEAKVMVYLEERSRSASDPNPNRVSPVTASWLAILFSALSVGSQYHDSPYHVRKRDSQKYMQIAFHLLRLGNFLLRPTFDSIQALLLTAFMLLNDMNVEASWALVGLTCRLAQSLGLHRPSPHEMDEIVPPPPSTPEMIKRRLWWTCTWHDTLTSLSFDRSPMTNFYCCRIPMQVSSSPHSLTYLETMYHLIEIISRRLNPDSMASAVYKDIVDNCQAVENLRQRTCPHIQDKNQCKSAVDRLQHYAVRLHTSFVVSVTCRPALRRDVPIDPVQKQALAHRCKTALTETVRMFLAMHQLSVIPTRSWAFTYHGLSSALLLGIIADARSDPEIRQLQGDLIAALSATASRDRDDRKDSSSSPVVGGARDRDGDKDRDIELSGPLSRALAALKNIHEHGCLNVSRLKRPNPGGNRSPLPPMMMGRAHANLPPPVPFDGMPPRASDRREDAALAMAEMQNGAYVQPMQQGMANDSLGIDLQYMAPMDVFESIWDESPLDPWHGGMDYFSFGIILQPPQAPSQQQQSYF